MIEEDGYYLKVKLTPSEISLIAEEFKNETTLGDFMMLGNETERFILQEILSVDLSEYCFDWIIVKELTDD